MSAFGLAGDPHALVVVIPALDAERYLAEAVESALAQTRRPAEVIVVDDGSRDGTALVAASFAPRGVRLVAQENRGCAAARNRGVAATSAPLVAFLDADDAWPADRLERLVSVLAAEPALDAVTGQVESFCSPELSERDRERFRVPAGPQPGWLPGAIVVRRAAWERVGPFDEAIRNGGEFIDWIARARTLGVAIGRHEALALRRRVHPASMTVRAREALERSYLDVVRARLARARTGGAPHRDDG